MFANKELNKSVPTENKVNLDVLKKLQDSLSAEYLYTAKINTYKVLITLNNLLSIIVPIILINTLYFVKGGPYEEVFNTISFVSALALLVLTTILAIFSIPDKKETFIVARRINRKIQQSCKENLYIKNKKLKFFFDHIHDIDNDDLDKLGNIRTAKKQASYRYALEKAEINGYNIACAGCNKTLPTHNGRKCKTCGLK